MRDDIGPYKHESGVFLRYLLNVDVNKLKANATPDSFAEYYLEYVCRAYKLIRDILLEYNEPVVDLQKEALHTLDPTTIISHSLGLPLIDLSQEDYYLNIWGPRFWAFLHRTSILTNNKTRLAVQFAVFLLNFDILLPCSNCQKNFALKDPYLKLFVPIVTAINTIQPVFEFHNLVNAATGKREFTFDEFKIKYGLERDQSDG